MKYETNSMFNINTNIEAMNTTSLATWAVLYVECSYTSILHNVLDGFV